MNILYTTTLSAIFIKCVSASSDDALFQFRKAVDEGSMDRAAYLYESIRGEHGEMDEMFNHVVDTRDQEFIFKFAKQAKVGEGHLLATLHRKRSPKMIEEAFKVFKFGQKNLVYAASRPELMCSPNDLFNLLGKIERQKDRETVINLGVFNLFNNNRPECFDPLLDAFESNESFRHLSDVAIQSAFKSGTVNGVKMSVERFHDHHAVTPEVYAQGLINSGLYSVHKSIFDFLLKEADQNDLNAVKGNRRYNKSPEEFRKAIEDASITAKSGGTRSTLPIQRAKLVMVIFEEDSSVRMPTVIYRLITSYLVEAPTFRLIIPSLNQVKVPIPMGKGRKMEPWKKGKKLGLKKRTRALTLRGETDEDVSRSLPAAFEDLGNMATNLRESDDE